MPDTPHYISYAFPLFALTGQTGTTEQREILQTSQSYLLLMNLFIALFLLGALIFLLIRVKSYKSKNSKSSQTIEMTPEELKAIYGDKTPDELKSLDRMSREELRIIAEKELEKQGLKPGEKDFFKGPLDWEDLDENFKPRPKVIRSDISFHDSRKITDKYKSDDSKKTPPKNESET